MNWPGAFVIVGSVFVLFGGFFALVCWFGYLSSKPTTLLDDSEVDGKDEP